MGFKRKRQLFINRFCFCEKKTERQEAVDVGAVKVVGTDPTSIQQAVFTLLNDHKAYKKMDQAENPFGDGHASERILDIIEDYLGRK